MYRVSIHAPVRGATVLVVDVLAQVGVSIHAPVRGATAYEACKECRKTVSIHAPVRGATDKSKAETAQIYVFQSTHP